MTYTLQVNVRVKDCKEYNPGNGAIYNFQDKKSREDKLVEFEKEIAEVLKEPNGVFVLNRGGGTGANFFPTNNIAYINLILGEKE